MAPLAINQFDIHEREGKLAVFDASYLGNILYYVSAWRSSRIVLVASKTLHSGTDYVRRLEEQLGDRVVGQKIGVGAHSPYGDVIEIAHLLQDKRADCLISIGSSSYSDASKIASKLANTLPPGFGEEDMERLIETNRGRGITEEAKVKVILVPTSLSAAEWNGTGSCTNAEGKKQHFGLGDHRKGAPDLILCDPNIAGTAPEILWLSSGVRCIDHCIETICNKDCTKEVENDALAGLSEMLNGLIRYKHSTDQGRAELLQGISNAQKGSREAIKALIVHKNTFGPSHAIGHQLGSVCGVMHGLTSCILLAPVLQYTSSSEDPSFKRARSGQAKILGIFNDVLGWQENNAAHALTKFVKNLGLPTTLKEVGVTNENQIEAIAEKTLTDVWGGGEKQIHEKQEVMKILDSAR